MSDATPTPGAAAAGATDPADLGVLEAARELRARRLSSAELTDAVLARIAARNGGEPTFDGAPDAVNAWARVYPDEARALARAADERRAREGDEAPLLCGIPLGLKDLYAVAGLPVTASSRMLEGNVASEDAVVWARLKAAGMVLVGHTHTHEFAFGGTTDQVGNPWDLARSAGGSSGGSAAALAARMVPAATGTDTAGSVRIPAAMSASARSSRRTGACRSPGSSPWR
jgi:aspartyl-tRNA(Asn)/glutamyl-tRNA(Gln) amidotransferase subunit A